jgi:hypothetical protein
MQYDLPEDNIKMDLICDDELVGICRLQPVSRRAAIFIYLNVFSCTLNTETVFYANASQPPGRGPVVGPGINYTGPQEALLQFVIFIL